MDKEKTLIREELERAFTVEKLKLEKEFNRRMMACKKQPNTTDQDESSKIEVLESSAPPACPYNNLSNNSGRGWNIVNSPIHQRLSQKTSKKVIKSPAVSSPKTEDSTMSFWGPSAIFESIHKSVNGKNQRNKRKRN
jgi:hypothetical protein